MCPASATTTTGGFYLSDGGYYFAINDNIDLALTGEIYTKGSWGLRAASTYAKRYKYSGNFNLSYLKTITGEKGSPDYLRGHELPDSVEPLAGRKVQPQHVALGEASIFTTSGYTRSDLNSYYSRHSPRTPKAPR